MRAGSSSLVGALAASHKISSFVFSLCLTFDGGMMSLGGEDSSLHTGEVDWSPLTSSTRFYTVVLEAVSVNGVSLDGIADANG
jgi:hypothetical protein